MLVKSAARTLDVFEIFASRRAPLRLTELAQLLHMPTSSCLHLLGTLQQRGYVQTVEGNRLFYPTALMRAHVDRISSADPVLMRLGPILRDLQEKTGETVVLSRLNGREILFLDVQESKHAIRYSAAVGDVRRIFHTTSAGKSLLSAVSDEERSALLGAKALAGATPKTIKSRAALEKDLEESRARGWFGSREESMLGLASIGAPAHVFGQLFAIVVGGPVQRFDPMDRYAPALLEAVRRAEN